MQSDKYRRRFWEAILGIRPTFEGLQVSPVIPIVWDNFEVTRIFRGVRYIIHVQRTGVGNDVRLEVAGKPVNGNIIPLPKDGTEEVNVMVALG